MVTAPVGTRTRRLIARFWHCSACALVGIRIQTEGRPVLDRATLFVVNHVSYLDIPILGTWLDTVFVAKREVAGWLGFGTLARLGKTVFVTRRPLDAAADVQALSQVLLGGRAVALFPEGTSSGGLDVLPFRSTLFEVAYAWTADGRVDVQPVTLSYTRAADGGPSPLAWYGDMDFLSHLLRGFTLPATEVRIRFHAPVRARRFADRKALASHCRDCIAKDLRELREPSRPAA
jgi:1-acyl-sn-glycerol-3-phosphate acyltransferase